MKATILILACLLPLRAQSLSYGTVARPGATIDFRNASTVMPDRHLAADPASCALGERYFNTATAKTRRCTAANTWSDEGGATYTLPPASASMLGGVKVGSGLAVDTGGVLSATVSGGPVCDPFDLTRFCWAEDFAFGGTSSGQLGAGGFLFSAISSGTFGQQNVVSLAATQHPGIVKITSTSTVNSGGNLRAQNSSTNYVNLEDWLTKEWEVRWIARLESTTDARVRIGLTPAAGSIVPAANESSFLIRYDTDAAFADNTKNTVGSWVAQFCGYSGTSCSDGGGVTAVMDIQPDTNWHVFRIYRSGTTIYFQVDNNAPKTLCASGCDMALPAVANPSSGTTPVPALAFGISSTTQRICYIDYVSVKLSGLAR